MKKPTHIKEEEAYLEREAYVRQTLQRIARISRKIDDLANRCEAGTTPAIVKLKARIPDLRQKQQAATWRANEVESARLDHWTELKAGADMAMIILTESYEKLLSLANCLGVP